MATWAALGTIADVMPLTHDNRTLVRHGLELLADSARPGIRALVELAGLSGRPMTAVSAAFGLAPRINAAGRMGDVYDALELLLCEDEGTAGKRRKSSAATTTSARRSKRRSWRRWRRRSPLIRRWCRSGSSSWMAPAGIMA